MLSLSSPGCGSETVNVKEFAERRLIPRLAAAIEQAALIQRADDLLQLFRALIEDRFQRLYGAVSKPSGTRARFCQMTLRNWPG